MLKKVERTPDWLAPTSVLDIYSVSSCISKNFADYVPLWKHNGYWLFDSPEIIRDLAETERIDTTGHQLFYYELYECEFSDDDHTWREFEPAPFTTDVRTPQQSKIEGYDVVTFSVGTSPECSPLSCNSLALAPDITVNRHCLLDSFEEATNLLEAGKFADCEPGPFRIFAVYSLMDR